jgi:hypothetical protein
MMKLSSLSGISNSNDDSRVGGQATTARSALLTGSNIIPSTPHTLVSSSRVDEYDTNLLRRVRLQDVAMILRRSDRFPEVSLEQIDRIRNLQAVNFLTITIRSCWCYPSWLLLVWPTAPGLSDWCGIGPITACPHPLSLTREQSRVPLPFLANTKSVKRNARSTPLYRM